MLKLLFSIQNSISGILLLPIWDFSLAKETQEQEESTVVESLDSLVRAAQQGNSEAFNSIVERFQDMACASAYAMCGHHQLAEDATQEAFLEVYLTLDRLREPAAFFRWFRSILFKQVDRLTRGKRLMSIPLEAAAELPGTEQNPPDLIEMREINEQVRRAIGTLNERERMVVFLFYSTGYALKEIAAFLDVPITTIKKRLYGARQHLKDELLDLMSDVLQEQRASIAQTFPAKVRLLIAARLGDLDTVKQLLTQNPTLLNMQMEFKEVRQRLLLAVSVGITALHEATMHDHTRVACLLLDYGANINARTSSGLTPLHGAVMFRCHTTAAVLLTRGANAEFPLNNGLTALHQAAMYGDAKMTRLLLAHGAAVDSQSQHARTPCHWAALKGHVEVVHLLLAYGADEQAHDSTGRTPRDWAIANGHPAIVAMLQERMTCL